MPRVIIDHFDPPSSPHAARVRSWASERAADQLAGRRVWCAAASARGRDDALAMGDRLRAGSEGLAADPLAVDDSGTLPGLAMRLDALLSGLQAADATMVLGADDRAGCLAAVARAEDAIGRDVGGGDLVLVHDAVAALAAQAVRARGAHVVWHLRGPARSMPAGTAGAARAVLDLLRRYTGVVDAYVSSSVAPAPGGGLRRRVSVLMPVADVLAATETVDTDPGGQLAWRSALADVVTDDREEHVGGRIHIRPAVPAR
jgi:hypothetical protein